MNAKDFDKIATARMDWCMKTLCAKGDEYARDGDRLWNFKVAARKMDCHPAEALAGMMVKHTVSVDDIIDGLAKGIVPPRELVAEKIGDSIDYLLLLEGLIEEERRVREEVPELNADLFEPWQAAIGEQVATGSSAMDALLASASRVEVHNGPNGDSRVPMPEVYGGHVVCSGCGLKCSIGSEQEQSVNLTGRCTICLDEKERETYTVPPLQDGDDDPVVVHIVPDKTSRSTLPSGCLGRLCGRGDDDEWRPCPEDAL